MAFVDRPKPMYELLYRGHVLGYYSRFREALSRVDRNDQLYVIWMEIGEERKRVYPYP